MEVIGIWIAAFLTLMMYSFLYKDNPFYKFGEHLYLGISVGYFICVTWFEVFVPKLVDPVVVDQNYWLFIPTVLGAFMLTRFVRQIAWMSRWSMAYYIGFGAGVAVPSILLANIMRQLENTMTTIYITKAAGGFDYLASFSQLIIVIGVLCVLTYFYFSIEHKGFVGRVGRIGIYFLMISFGAAFGYTVMARVSLLIGRVQFLLYTWLGMYFKGLAQ
jgi:hypothetical protein